MIIVSSANYASGAAFTPASLTNLKAWWKADAGVTNSGSPSYNVTNIADQSGNSNALTTKVGGGVVSATPTSTLNSKQVIGFSTAGIQTGAFALGGTQLAVFAVLKSTSYGSADRIFGLNVSGADNTAAGGSFSFYPNNTDVVSNNGANRADSGAVLTGATWYQMMATWGGTAAAIYINNTQTGSTSAPSVSFAATLTSFDVFSNPTGGNYLTGNLAEMVVMGSEPTATERNNMHTYLQTRWGVG